VERFYLNEITLNEANHRHNLVERIRPVFVTYLNGFTVDGMQTAFLSLRQFLSRTFQQLTVQIVGLSRNNAANVTVLHNFENNVARALDLDDSCVHVLAVNAAGSAHHDRATT
jgi:hypothetical protein